MELKQIEIMYCIFFVFLNALDLLKDIYFFKYLFCQPLAICCLERLLHSPSLAAPLLGGPQSCLGYCIKEKRFLPVTGIYPRTFSYPTCSQVTVLTY